MMSALKYMVSQKLNEFVNMLPADKKARLEKFDYKELADIILSLLPDQPVPKQPQSSGEDSKKPSKQPG